MWSRVRLDIGWNHLLYALRACAARDRERREAAVEALWSRDGDSLTAFSVRSGFDLVLQALELPEGSEILFTALNIKGMPKIARRQGLVPVPVDLDPETMEPDLASLERAIGPATRAVVVAPLFGTRGDRTPLVEIARRHDLLVIEDCAQAFAGSGWRGSPEAVVSMFSFGPLKFATALGGAILTVRDPELLETMRKIQETYPVMPTGAFATRVLKFCGLKLMTAPVVLGTVARVFRVRGRDYEDAVAEPVRGVAKLGSARKVRFRCGAPLLALLERRLRSWRPDPDRVRAARTLYEALRDCVHVPAAGADVHSHWAFPIVVDDPDRVMRTLRDAGFDAATLRRSATLAPPQDRPGLDPVHARETLEKLVVIPCYAEMPDRELRRQADVIRGAVASC